MRPCYFDTILPNYQKVNLFLIFYKICSIFMHSVVLYTFYYAKKSFDLKQKRIFSSANFT